jgi:hypothetical protein
MNDFYRDVLTIYLMKKIYTEKKWNLRVLSPSFGGKKEKERNPKNSMLGARS